MCPISKQYVAATFGVDEYGDDESANAMGIALNGVAFQFANQLREDPMYPITEANEQPLDLCLGHNQLNSDSGMYHYHGISPCINADFLAGKTMDACEDTPDCALSITDWAISGFAGMQTQTVIGIGKDGHVLYGPYDDSGQLWTTGDVDACNGAWSADKSDYFYVGTRWHPYLVGCLGPANFPQNEDPELFAQCSLNGMDVYAPLPPPSPPPPASPTPAGPSSIDSGESWVESSDSDEKSDDEPLIIGVSVAAAALCAAVLGGLVMWRRRLRRRSLKAATYENSSAAIEIGTSSDAEIQGRA